MERADHSSAASGTFRFWPPGSRTVCHVSLTGLRQCPDPLNSPPQAASWRGVNAEVCLAPSGCLHRRFTSVRLGALLQTTARIPVGITALWISPFCLGDIRRCSMMGGRASAENHALTSPVIHPSGPCFPTNSAIPGLPSYTRPHSALRRQRLSALQNAGHIWPNMARVAIKILEESPINDGSWGSCSHPPTSPDRKLISLRGCGCKSILRREGVVPSLQAATVMGLSTSSVFPSRWYAAVHGGMGMQSFFSLDLAWPGPSQTLARIGLGQTAPARLDCHPRLVLRGCL